jgi:hypothetical protein
MYGAPFSSLPTSVTLATCPLLRFASETRHGFTVTQHLRQQELDRDPFVEVDVMGRDDDAHAARTEDPFDAVLPREEFALPDAGHFKCAHRSSAAERRWGRAVTSWGTRAALNLPRLIS